MATADSTSAPEGTTPDPKAPTDLAARVKAKRGTNGVSAPAPSADAPESTSDTSAPLAATNGISPNASDELAKLAAQRGETTSGSTPKGKSKSTKASTTTSPASAPSTDAGTDATASPSDLPDGIPTEIPGLTSQPANGDGKSAYEKRQAELAAARAAGGKPKGKAKKKPLTEKQQAALDAKIAREKEAKEKAKAKEKAAKETDKAKAKKEKEKEAQAARKKRDDERKAEIAKKKAAVAAQRAARATPDLLGKEPKAIQELFAQHYKQALDDKVRRPKCDRGDFCAGWLTLLKMFRKSNIQLPTPAKAEAAAS